MLSPSVVDKCPLPFFASRPWSPDQGEGTWKVLEEVQIIVIASVGVFPLSIPLGQKTLHTSKNLVGIYLMQRDVIHCII